MAISPAKADKPLFAAGELVAEPFGEMADAEIIERRFSPRPGLVLRTAGVERPEHDVPR